MALCLIESNNIFLCKHAVSNYTHAWRSKETFLNHVMMLYHIMSRSLYINENNLHCKLEMTIVLHANDYKL